MSERGLPLVDGAPACPFVAFDDDRDERAASPDHRHRCYAEVRPAPRALAHQEAYCLSSAFPVCPTFQDWARREAARARPGSAAPPSAVADEPRRNPPREWTAPPPWLAESRTGEDRAANGSIDAPEDAPPPGFLASREVSGTAVTPDPARREEPIPGGSGAAASGAAGPDAIRSADGAEPGARGLAGSRADRMAGAGRAADDVAVASTAGWLGRDDDEVGEPGPRRAEAGAGPLAAFGIGGRRPKVGDTRRGPELRGPSWERPVRYEAYPTLRTRVGMPPIPRLGVLAAALVVAAVVLFFLPALLGLVPGGDGDGNGVGVGSPSPTAPAATPSPEPTPVPAPTPQIYIVQPGDTMSRIANRFGVPLADLVAANRESIPNPDAIDVGDEVIIPAPSVAPTVAPSPASSPAPP